MSHPDRQIVATRRVYEGEVIHLRVDTVALKGGRTHDFEVVEHGGAVAMVPVDDEGNVYLIRQYRDAIQKHLLEIPAGGLEPGEPPVECARRELQEEINCYPEQLEELGSFTLAPGYSTECLTIYLARGLRPSSLRGDVDEDIVIERMPIREALRLTLTNEIQDAKTALGLLLAATRPGVIPSASGG
jgi:ADP-ribose pyrophosphatase